MSQPNFDFKIDQSFQNALTSMKLAELKELLKALGEKISGTKGLLIERAISHFLRTQEHFKTGKISASVAQSRFSLVKGSAYYSPLPTEAISSHLKRSAPPALNDVESPVKKLKTDPAPHLDQAGNLFANPHNIRLDLSDDPFFQPVQNERPLLQFAFKNASETRPFDFSPEKFALVRQNKYRVIVRCFSVDTPSTKGAPAHLWPNAFCLRINGSWADLIQKNEKKKTLPKSADITPLLQRGSNELFMAFQGQHSYYLSMQLMKRILVEDLVQTVPNCPFEESKKRVLDLFAVNSMEVEAVSSKVSLIDPLVRTRINLAARARHCRHIQCFDLCNYLKSNERGGSCTWLCPVCSGGAPFDSLLVDGFLSCILEQTPEGEETVQLNPDGTWTQPRHDGLSGPSGNQRAVVDLIDSSDEEGSETRTPLSNPPLHRPSIGSTSTLCIDLDDDS